MDLLFIITVHDVSWAAQTGKHLLRTQNVSEQNQKHLLCPGHEICVRNKCFARAGKHLCRQQCVRNNMSSFARTVRSAACSVEKSRILITIPRSLDIVSGRPSRQEKNIK